MSDFRASNKGEPRVIGKEIKTKRFLLKKLTVNDATKRYLSWFGGLATKKYIVYAESERSLEELRTYIENKSSRDDIAFFGIFVARGLQHIGNIKYDPIDSKKKYAVMGILIGDEEWQGKGVAVEVIKATGEWLHKKKGINQIILGVDINNSMGVNAYKKIGFSVQESNFINLKGSQYLTMVWDLL